MARHASTANQPRDTRGDCKTLGEFFRLSPDLLAVAATNGTLLSINPAWHETLGWTSDDCLGHSVVDFMHEDDRSAVIDELRAIGNHGQASWQRERRMLCKGGGHRWIAWMVQQHADRLYGIGRDVTQYQQLNERIHQAQKLEALGHLARGVAHDFNNVLNAVSGYSELLEQGLPLESPLRAYVHEVLAASQNGMHLTRQLLAFGAERSGNAGPLDVGTVVASTQSMLTPLLGRGRTALDLTSDPHLPLVLADTGQVEQILVNLVVNARDAMPAGGIIAVRTRNVWMDRSPGLLNAGGGRYVELSVSDTGCGMDAETRERIFEPLFTTKPAGKGTGLGLSTVHDILMQLHGDIAVESAVGVGSTFRVYLPAASAPCRQAEASELLLTA